MGRLARSTLAAGGYVTGIIPSFLIRKEHPLTDAQEMLVVEDMHERKQAMFDRADAFVALPGGVGTLEELVEQMTWAQLNRHTKPILIADIGGFWRPLLAPARPHAYRGLHSRGLRGCAIWWRKKSRTCCRCCTPRPSAAQPSLSHRTRSPLATCNVRRAWRVAFAIVAPSSRAQVLRGSSAAREWIHDEMDLGGGAWRRLCAALSSRRRWRRTRRRPQPAHQAQAQDFERPSKTSEGAATVTMVVTNSRKADLVQLQATESGLVGLEESAGRAEVRQSRAGATARIRSTAASTCMEPSATASRWMRPTSTSARKRRSI